MIMVAAHTSAGHQLTVGMHHSRSSTEQANRAQRVKVRACVFV